MAVELPEGPWHGDPPVPRDIVAERRIPDLDAPRDKDDASLRYFDPFSPREYLVLALAPDRHRAWCWVSGEGPSDDGFDLTDLSELAGDGRRVPGIFYDSTFGSELALRRHRLDASGTLIENLETVLTMLDLTVEPELWDLGESLDLADERTPAAVLQLLIEPTRDQIAAIGSPAFDRRAEKGDAATVRGQLRLATLVLEQGLELIRQIRRAVG